MTDWELMKEIAHANNNQDQNALSKIIMENDIQGRVGVIDIAISCFHLSEDNVKNNINAAKKLAALDAPEAFKEQIRHRYLIELLKEIEAGK